MNGELVTVLKDGILTNIEAGNLNKGDIVILQAGDIVPADLKLIESRNLEIDEFELNGEIMPVIKRQSADDVTLYMGSTVVRGTGQGLVVAIGEQTEYGKVLQQEAEQVKPYHYSLFKKQYLLLVGLLLPAFVILFVKSHLDITMIFYYIIVSVIFILVQNDRLFSYLITSSEIKRLERLGIQIQDQEIIERLNDIDIICFDKTGVLTTRQMDITQLFFMNTVLNANSLRDNQNTVAENTIHLTMIGSALCHDVNYLEKLDTATPVDKALISFALKVGIDVGRLLQESRRFYDKPFDAENRYMACGYLVEGKEYYFAKGDPDVIVNLCRSYQSDTGTVNSINANFLLQTRRNMNAIAHDGDTVIALAYSCHYPGKMPKEYIFLCLLRLENSLKPNALRTISEISSNRIRSLLVTGDKKETAIKIAFESGITSESKAILTGNSIERLGWMEVARQASYCSVFARLTPSQKGLLILRLQQAGHKVAMVGDGPNDSVALKVADIGISLVKDSSIIARRLSKILVVELYDIMRLIKSARKVRMSAGILRFFRLLFISISLVGIYAWAFLSR